MSAPRSLDPVGRPRGDAGGARLDGLIAPFALRVALTSFVALLVALAVGGVILTATRLVNAIPTVVEHAPGMMSALDLPLITGKGLHRPKI